MKAEVGQEYKVGETKRKIRARENTLVHDSFFIGLQLAAVGCEKYIKFIKIIYA